MKKLFFSFMCLLMTTLSYAVEPIKTLTFPDYNDKQIQTYTDTWTATVDGETWTISGFNNNKNGWAYIRCGQKSAVNTASITTPAFAATVTSVVYTVDKTSHVTSATFTVKNGDEVVSTQDVTESFAESTAAKDVTVDVADAKVGYTYTLTLVSEVAGSNGTTQISKVAVYGTLDETAVAAPTFSVKGDNYYEPVDVEITTTTEGATIMYSTDGENYSEYTSAINVAETTTLYAKAVKGEKESSVVSATYTIAKAYASLTELNEVAAEGQPVVVTITNEPILSIYTTSKGNRNGIYLAAGDAQVEIYCYDVPEDWEVGGKVSGTLKGLWKSYNGTNEVCPSSWDDLTYKAVSFANDFEDGTLGDWTAAVPESPYKGGFSVVTYAAESSLKVDNVGENELGGTNCLLSMTGAKNKVKDNSDNWLTSPAVTVKEDAPIFSFRLAANCSYSPTKEEAEKMKMDVVVIDGDESTVIATIAPENYFTWKQYAFDLTSYVGKSIKVAFHDYGTAGSGAVGEMKYIDNIKMGAEAYSDYAIEEVTPVYGQAQLSAPYTIRVTNYGVSKGEFTANYAIGEAVTTETVESAIAGGESVEYTFQANPTFAVGQTADFHAYVAGADDAIAANDATATQSVTTCEVQTIPYAICNAMDEEGNITDDAVETEFATATASSKAKWAYDPIKYNAWIYTQTKSDDKYVGVSYLYTTKAFTLPAGKVNLKTIGTATLTDMMYEVYIGKYGAEGMADYATKVGESEIMRDVPNTGGGIDTTTVELTIPEAGDYVIAIRPINHLANAQMTIIGYSLEEAVAPLTATFDPADGTELASFEKGDKITATFSQPDAVGYAEWILRDNNPADENDAVLRTGMMKKNTDGSWYGKFYSQQKLLAGHTYTVEVYPYASEADMQAESDHNTYANALGKFTATYTGTTSSFEYSPVTLVSVSPVEGTVLKTVNDNVITAVFTDVVTLTANKNGGMGGENTAMQCASEDGKTWTITIPESVLTSTSGSLNINVYVKDADGKVVKGDAGEDETSYFIWSYVTYIGSPEFTVTPGSGEVEKIDKIRVSYDGGINFSWQTAEKIQVYNEANEVVYTFDNDNDVSYDWDDITWLDFTLATPITKAGTYTVVFPTIFFALGEEFDGYMSKEQKVTYIVTGVADGISNINATDNTPAYNIAGQRVNNNASGIIIKNGKKYLK